MNTLHDFAGLQWELVPLTCPHGVHAEDSCSVCATIEALLDARERGCIVMPMPKAAQ